MRVRVPPRVLNKSLNMNTILDIKKIEPNSGQIEGLPSNPRQWDQTDVDRLAESIEETPELLDARPLIVVPLKDKFIVLGGNLRLAALKKLKRKNAPCYILPDDTPADKMKEIVIKDNGSFGQWDMGALANEWGDLPLPDWGVPEWEPEKKEDTQEEVVEEDNFDEYSEVVKRCKLGDLWELGQHRLMCGDSTDPEMVKRLMGGETADMVFTDPPYGVSYVGVNNPNGKEWKMIKNDDLRDDALYQFLLKAFLNIAKTLKEDGAFYIWFASINHIQFETALNNAGLRVKQELIWDKGMVLGHSDYHWAYEPCLYGTHIGKNSKWYGDRKQKTLLALNRNEIKKLKKEQMEDILTNIWEGRTCWRINRDNVMDYVHPTQKPIELAGRGMKNSSAAGQIVLDLFGGSGSTLMAAEQLNRKCMVMEFDPHYCDVIIARWEKFTGKEAVKLG